MFLIGAGATLLDDLEPAAPPDEGGAPTASPGERMDRQQRALYAIVPYYDCAPVPDGQLLPGAIAGIRCDPGPGRVETLVTYQRFRPPARADRAYEARLRELRDDPGVTIVEDSKWCRTTTYAPVCYGSNGRMVFSRDGGTVQVDWTSPGGVYATAHRADGNMKRLRATWSGSDVDF